MGGVRVSESGGSESGAGLYRAGRRGREGGGRRPVGEIINLDG